MQGVANPKLRHVEFEVGQKVWLSSTHLPVRVGARKLAAKWAGPFVVASRVGTVAYKLTLPGAWRVHPVFHVS